MGRYRLGDIIRMTRKSLSMTQENLSDEICSVETLSRIENGSQNPSRETYELLMERMGRIRDRAYSMLTVSDYKVLDKMKQLEELIILYDFKQAEAVLKELKKLLGKSVLDIQYITRAESIINFRLNKINAEEYLDGVIKAIKLTIPKYGSISLSSWPLSYSEANLLTNIANAYIESENYEKAAQVLEEALSALKQSYMEEQHRIYFQITMINNLSKLYGLFGKHENAIEYALEGIQLCKKYKLGNALPNLLYSVAWNKEKLIELGVLSPEEKSECIKYLQEAYYIASAMQLPLLIHYVKKHFLEYYNISI